MTRNAVLLVIEEKDGFELALIANLNSCIMSIADRMTNPVPLIQVQRHFARFVAEESRTSPIWLDYNLVPLRWQYPIGLLFDLVANDAPLPWNITVHFNDFPTKEVLACPNRQVLNAHVQVWKIHWLEEC